MDKGSSDGPIINIENSNLMGIYKIASHLLNNNIVFFLIKISYHIDYYFVYKRLYKEKQRIFKIQNILF